jgi:hypothetical protein
VRLWRNRRKGRLGVPSSEGRLDGGAAVGVGFAGAGELRLLFFMMVFAIYVTFRFNGLLKEIKGKFSSMKIYNLKQGKILLNTLPHQCYLQTA